MSENDLVIAWTTAETKEDAQRLAGGAVTAGLAACAQIDSPIQSFYIWEAKVEDATEWRILFKTTAARQPDLEAWIEREHPYDTPQWLVTPVTHAGKGYASWVVEMTQR